ncbi:hypothetical protein PSW42_11500, partial [Yersinia pestis]|nr:hypothetical protein [Yersinia pestis]
SYLLSRASLPAIPCFPTCYPVLPYLLSRASLPAIPCFPTCYPVLHEGTYQVLGTLGLTRLD